MIDTLQIYLCVSAILFNFGIFAVITRKNAVAILMGIELILNAANEKDLEAKVKDIVDSKRIRMTADDGELIAVEVLEEIVQH